MSEVKGEGNAQGLASPTTSEQLLRESLLAALHWYNQTSRGVEDGKPEERFLSESLSAIKDWGLRERLDELKLLPIRSMDDPADDTNLFWYRTYTKPEFDARISTLEAELREEAE